ncbi:MAG TPA: pyridoxamine 5'-phosphate oxidase [Pyrinomonadaceae bacterium]|jgi:pyridoxamine 5'-phosphate oxidase|nr:pyridoxamine 5'-phosphate oxidase [Pyrinomonadaceae bacterium]
MKSKELAALRREYSLKQLSRVSISPDPFDQFSVWMSEAISSEILDATAMTIATVDPDCRPSARVVLLKGYGPAGFVFYTNYESRKARDLAANPNAVVHFFWPELERQIIINGEVGKTSREESEAYFASRPTDSKIGAWASNQSSKLPSREALEESFEEMKVRFGDDVPLPPFWGGFRLVPERFEFWQGRASRLHDRICYERAESGWEIFRLSP